MIQAVIEAGLIAPLVNLLQYAEFDIKKEAAWALSNATFSGTPEQIKYLVSYDCIKPLCDLLVCPDPKIIIVCLECLENILKVGEAEKRFCNTRDVNLYAQMIEDAEGLEKIENLQSHDNNEIYENAVRILETYWLEDEDETLPPSHGRQDRDLKHKIVRLYSLANPWHARVCLESKVGWLGWDRCEKSWERWNRANMSFPLLGFSDIFSRVGSAAQFINSAFWDLKP
ncbi:hypothetical protein MtrunA17_Chr4g0071961 [Medicago truncatula]|nr:hypothetical protein MtrunA17_Chr4g0071961 [Medicago truncatula]